MRRMSASHVAQDSSPAISADTIYFGGGTPSLLEPDEIGRIIGACRAAFDVAGDSEITLEANPESVDQARLAGFRAAGVNRLSFGVQSFREPELRRLSRLHTADRARAAVAEARAAGFDNLSLDLMMWLPEQQVTEWLESVDAAIALGPDHLSLYLLEVYPNAPLKDEMARARWSQAPDEDAAAMYVTAMERLDAVGIRTVRDLQRRAPRTAIAAQPQVLVRRGVARLRLRRAFHPRGCPLEECRVHGGVRADGWRVLSRPLWTTGRCRPEERLGDALFTGLRLTEGVNLDAIRVVYGVDVWARYGARAGTVSPGGAAAAGGRPDVADASGNASCSRSHDYFRIALELCFGLEYQSFCLFKEAVMFRSLVRPAVVGRPARFVGLLWDWSPACSRRAPFGRRSLPQPHRRSPRKRARSASRATERWCSTTSRPTRPRISRAWWRRSRKRSPRARSPSARRRRTAGRSSRPTEPGPGGAVTLFVDRRSRHQGQRIQRVADPHRGDFRRKPRRSTRRSPTPTAARRSST